MGGKKSKKVFIPLDYDAYQSINPYPNCRAIQREPRMDLLVPGEPVALDSEFQNYRYRDGKPDDKGHHRLGRISIVNMNRDVILDTFVVYPRHHNVKKFLPPLHRCDAVHWEDLTYENGAQDAQEVESWVADIVKNRPVIFHASQGDREAFQLVPNVFATSEIIDTQILYSHLSRNGKPSLKSLTSSVLHRRIQQTTHDSVEDAKATGDLYWLTTQTDGPVTSTTLVEDDEPEDYDAEEGPSDDADNYQILYPALHNLDAQDKSAVSKHATTNGIAVDMSVISAAPDGHQPSKSANLPTTPIVEKSTTPTSSSAAQLHNVTQAMHVIAIGDTLSTSTGDGPVPSATSHERSDSGVVVKGIGSASAVRDSFPNQSPKPVRSKSATGQTSTAQTSTAQTSKAQTSKAQTTTAQTTTDQNTTAQTTTSQTSTAHPTAFQSAASQTHTSSHASLPVFNLHQDSPVTTASRKQQRASRRATKRA